MNGFVPAPGTLRLAPVQPNPYAAANSLFLLLGDATLAPIQKIELASGVALSPKSNYSDFHLQIFHFNDLHGHLMRFTHGGEEAVLPRIAGKIKAAQQEFQGKTDAAMLVFSAGDDCTGSIFDEILTDSGQPTPVHPGYQLYSKLGVAAAGLGNHDLDRGIPFLADSVQHNAHFPVLAANLKGCSSLSGVCHPAAILVVNGLRIGLIGLVTRAETHLDPKICQIVHPVPVAQNLVPALRPLCDVLIILSHLGYSLDSPVPMADVGDVELARSLPPGGVDLIIGGHSHTVLNEAGLDPENIVNGIPIVQTGARGKYLGQVDLQINRNGVNLTAARLIPTASLPNDSAFDAEMQPFVHRAREIWFQPIGQVDDLPDLNTQIVLTGFAKREMALSNFVSDALVERLSRRGFQVDFAMIDASALQCGLPYSDHLTYGDCFEVMPFVDTLRLYQITGRQLQELLADNVLRIDHPGEPDIERGFLQFSQEIRYTIDLRIACVEESRFRGTRLESLLDQTFTVATTSFIRRLAEPWIDQQQRNSVKQLFDIHQLPFSDTDFFLRSETVAYIQEYGGVTRASGARCDGRLEIMERG